MLLLIEFELNEWVFPYFLTYFSLNLLSSILNVHIKLNHHLLCLQSQHFATPIWRKACKVVVEIAKMEWPQNWPNLLPQIFQIGNNSETAVVALTILQMLSEEISNMSGESKQDKDDIPEDRKESLYNSMLIVVDDLLRFLESILSSLYPGYYGTVLRAFIGKYRVGLELTTL